MLLGNYFHNINKNYKNYYFSGISFDTRNIKKNNINIHLKTALEEVTQYQVFLSNKKRIHYL